jgi:hypothetical protein
LTQPYSGDAFASEEEETMLYFSAFVVTFSFLVQCPLPV